MDIFDLPNRLPTKEAAELGGVVTLLGVVIVFLALVSLIILTIVYPKFFGWLLAKSAVRKQKRAERKAAKKLAKAEATRVDDVKITETLVTASTPEVKAQANDDELIAVITAAVAASLGTSSNGIRIRSLRRSDANTPTWGRKGRLEQFRF